MINASKEKYPYNFDNYSSGEYNTRPQIIKHENSMSFTTPVITNRNSLYQSPPRGSFDANVRVIPSCPCAAEVRCQPCSGLYLNFNQDVCGCAPKLNCPTCPPLSLIHKIAAKKVR